MKIDWKEKEENISWWFLTSNLQIYLNCVKKSCFYSKWTSLTLIVVRNLALVPSMKARQSSLLIASKTLWVALSMTISIPLNLSCTVWLNLSKSSLSNMSQCKIEIPADCDWSNSVWSFSTTLSVFPFTSITWQLCFDDNCWASSWESLVSPLVIYRKRINNEKQVEIVEILKWNWLIRW